MAAKTIPGARPESDFRCTLSPQQSDVRFARWVRLILSDPDRTIVDEMLRTVQGEQRQQVAQNDDLLTPDQLECLAREEMKLNMLGFSGRPGCGGSESRPDRDPD
jgi:hypothetical protein